MKSLAIAYGMKKKAKKMAEGGEVHADSEGKSIATIIDYPGYYDTKGRPLPRPSETPHAEGGLIDHDDVVDRVMRKRYSEGGRVANGGDDDLETLADSAPREFDDLALRDELESSNSGANAGDFLGNKQELDDRRDIVARVMRQRSMKQRNPRPA